MIVTIVRDDRDNYLVVDCPKTAALMTRIGEALTDPENRTKFAEIVRRTFPCPRVRSFRVHYGKKSNVLTFSRLAEPRCLTYRGLQVAVAQEDQAGLRLTVTETVTQRPV